MTAEDMRKIVNSLDNKQNTKIIKRVDKCLLKAANNGKTGIVLFDTTLPDVVVKHYKENGFTVETQIRTELSWSTKEQYITDTCISC